MQAFSGTNDLAEEAETSGSGFESTLPLATSLDREWNRLGTNWVLGPFLKHFGSLGEASSR